MTATTLGGQLQVGSLLYQARRGSDGHLQRYDICQMSEDGTMVQDLPYCQVLWTKHRVDAASWKAGTRQLVGSCQQFKTDERTCPHVEQVLEWKWDVGMYRGLDSGIVLMSDTEVLQRSNMTLAGRIDDNFFQRIFMIPTGRIIHPTIEEARKVGLYRASCNDRDGRALELGFFPAGVAWSTLAEAVRDAR